MAKKDLEKVNQGKQLAKSEKLKLVKDYMDGFAEAYGIAKMYQVGILQRASFGRQDIAFILDTSPRYVTNCMAHLKKDRRARQKLFEYLEEMPGIHQESRRALLPLVAIAQNKGVEYCIDNPQESVKHPGLLKQVAVQAGVDSEVGATKLIDIKVLIQGQNVLAQQQERTSKQIEADVIEGEIEEETKE